MITGMLPLVSKMTPAYTHITETFQQFFIYNEEAHFTSHTCAQVLELPQSHFGGYVLHSSCFCKIHFVYCRYKYIYTHDQSVDSSCFAL